MDRTVLVILGQVRVHQLGTHIEQPAHPMHVTGTHRFHQSVYRRFFQVAPGIPSRM